MPDAANLRFCSKDTKLLEYRCEYVLKLFGLYSSDREWIRRLTVFRYMLVSL